MPEHKQFQVEIKISLNLCMHVHKLKCVSICDSWFILAFHIFADRENQTEMKIFIDR